ncbi:TlpA disulfide reductase family protein [Pedobacter sp. MC2016-24]|uniref:TlpA family protein disulfide reductase n=1 Tax=Pedobacter sp. MC2016-24 TaxID=2780090 RepID=UPI00187F4269|nr:TlpA disulfide reductase family protein [Pedobacter sp. MC2016-24]MBE9598459.1 TlpA family protein disulfide reductase [Pedobacter sp. MC2016-24]
MKLKIVLLLLAQIALSQAIFAQMVIKSLKKGEQVPSELSLGKIVNYKSKNVKFSELKGKLVILDFWSTGCGPCIANLPDMENLQREFGDKIAIIPVTHEDSTLIANYFKRKKLGLPSIVNDSLLYGLFPHVGNPYEVWIDETGVVIATTDFGEVNSANISRYLLSKEHNLKNRSNGMFDPNIPLFVNGNGGEENQFVARSIFTNEIENLHWFADSHSVFDEKTKRNNINSYITLNSQLSYLFRECFWNAIKEPRLLCNLTRFFIEQNDKVIVPMADFSYYHSTTDSIDKLLGKEKHCYNLTLPGNGVSDSIFYNKYMLEDLNRYSSFNVRIEKKKLPSWVIINKNRQFNYLSTNLNNSNSKIIFDDNIEHSFVEEIVDIPFNQVIDFFKMYTLSPPMFNETGYNNEKIHLKNLHLKHGKSSVDDAIFQKMNLEEWRAAFQRNGLDIKVEDREVEVMVFKKKETPAK